MEESKAFKAHHIPKGKLYPEWMEKVAYVKDYKRPTNLPMVDNTDPADQHLWHFTHKTGGLLENEAQRINLFASRMNGLAFA